MKSHSSVGNQRKPVEKAIQALRWMVDEPGSDWGVREIARGMRLAPSTVHRVMSDLESQGLVHGDPATGRYSLGLEFFRLALKSTSRFELPEVAMPALERLVAASSETAFVSVYDSNRHEMMYVAALDSPHELRQVITLNAWTSLYVGASGFAILAFLTDAERRLIASGMRSRKDKTIQPISQSELASILERVQRNGYVCTLGRMVLGVVGICAPIFDSRKGVLGSIGLSIPQQRFADYDERRLAQLVVQAATDISKVVGGRFPFPVEP